jgi:hypothetical protein
MTLNKKNQSGFTIIELLIACLVITVGFLSVMSMITNAFSSTMPLSSNLTASYLTQEGFEIARRIRDGNFNERYGTGTPDPDWYWTEGLIAETSDYEQGSLDYKAEQLGKNEENFLYVDDQGLFSYDPPNPTDPEEGKTDFKRKIILDKEIYTYQDGVTTEYLLVTVEVSWTEKGTTKTHRATTKLFNWY